MPRRGSSKDGTVYTASDIDKTAVAPVVERAVKTTWTVTLVFEDSPTPKRFSIEAMDKTKATSFSLQVVARGFQEVSSDGKLETFYPAWRLLKIELRAPDAA